MGLSSEMFFLMFYRMIWFRDVLGMIVKGRPLRRLHRGDLLFRGTARSRSLRGRGSGDAGRERALDGRLLGGPIVRATCLSMVAILLVNMTWFLLVYHAVPVFGPRCSSRRRRDRGGSRDAKPIPRREPRDEWSDVDTRRGGRAGRDRGPGRPARPDAAWPATAPASSRRRRRST